MENQNLDSEMCAEPRCDRTARFRGICRRHYQRQYRILHPPSPTPEYKAWQAMRQRCGNPNTPQYARYGGRGIAVCQRWCESFEAFYEDMGPRPTPKHSVERINNNGNYEPSNCKWATRLEQGRNKRSNVSLTIGSVTRCAAEWATTSPVSQKTILERVRRGVPAQDAIFSPLHCATRVRRQR